MHQLYLIRFSEGHSHESEQGILLSVTGGFLVIKSFGLGSRLQNAEGWLIQCAHAGSKPLLSE